MLSLQSAQSLRKYWTSALVLVVLIVDVYLKIGTWAVEVAKEYHSARLVGLDLSPVHPLDAPPNCEFMVGDLTRDLDEFYDGSMNLVHSRCVQI